MTNTAGLTPDQAIQIRNSYRRDEAQIRAVLGSVEQRLGIIAYGTFLPGGEGTYAAMRVLRYLPGDRHTPYVIHTAVIADDRDTREPYVFFEQGFYYSNIVRAAAMFDEKCGDDIKFRDVRPA